MVDLGADSGRPAAHDPELAALEALADEIQAHADELDAEGEQAEQEGYTAADARAGPHGGDEQVANASAAMAGGSRSPWVHDCWEEATDLNSGQPYWFNRASGTSQWHPPAGWGQAASAAPTEQEQQAAPRPGSAAPAAPAAASALEAGGAQQARHLQSGGYEPGLYYRDAFGQMQGPFELDQLHEWRGMLAMDLPILHLRAAARRSIGDGKGDSRAADAEGRGSGNGDISHADDEPASDAAEGCWSQSELAGLLGDDDLLAHWRLQNPEQAAWPGTAPPAEVYAAERQRGTAHMLAEAVLYGLPVHDEAVSMARMAAVSGKSIQEVVEWSQAQGVDYSTTAYRVAAKGRIHAPGAPESLYSEASSWANPHELEQQLAKAAERRKRTLTAHELRQVKERKKQLKEKKRTAWLFT